MDVVPSPPHPTAAPPVLEPLDGPPAIACARGPMRQPIRILVVDDNSQLRDRLGQAFRDVGIKRPTAPPPPTARLGATFVPDLVLLEMVLGSGVVGPDLARRLRANRDPLLIFATRHARAHDKLAAFDAGADDYVVNPYETDEVLARVRALLRRSGRLSSQVSQVGPLVVDETAHRATLGDAAVDRAPPASPCWRCWPGMPARYCRSRACSSWCGATTPWTRTWSRCTSASCGDGWDRAGRADPDSAGGRLRDTRRPHQPGIVHIVDRGDAPAPGSQDGAGSPGPGGTVSTRPVQSVTVWGCQGNRAGSSGSSTLGV